MTEVALAGPGVLGRTLALSLPADVYKLGPVLSHSTVSSRRAVREMKRGVAVRTWKDVAAVQTILVMTPQRQTADVLHAAADGLPKLRGKRFLFAGVESRDVLAAIERLEEAGAHVGGLLPVALYRRPSIVAPRTSFALWGAPAALRSARQLVKALGGRYATIEPAAAAEVLLAVTVVSGALTTSLELAVRRLVRAGFSRQRALEALAALPEACIHEHRHSRMHPPQPRLPADCLDLLQASRRGPAMEDALCQTNLQLAREELA